MSTRGSVPRADGEGYVGSALKAWGAGFFKAINGISLLYGPASLNVGGTVVQNPASASGTPGASKMPLADANGRVDDWIYRQIGSLLINGNMDLWLDKTSISADGYVGTLHSIAHVGTMSFTASQSTDVPTVAQAGCALTYSAKIQITTAEAAIAATDYLVFQHKVEGTRFRDFAGQAITASFWVKSPKTGIHCLSLQSGGGDRTYVAEYTVISANTWEYKTVQATLDVTAGTWAYNTTTGMIVRWALACGSNFQQAAGSWVMAAKMASSNQVNCCDSTSNAWLVTGLRIDLGNAAKRLSAQPQDQCLAEVRRHYETSYVLGELPGNTDTNNGICLRAPLSGTINVLPMQYAVEKRAIPTLTIWSRSGSSGVIRDDSGVADLAANAYYTGTSRSSCQITGSTTAGNLLNWHWVADARL